MITPQSTPAEVIAHHRQNIAAWEATLAAAKNDYERADARYWIDGHRERLARAEKETP